MEVQSLDLESGSGPEVAEVQHAGLGKRRARRITSAEADKGSIDL